MFAQPGSRDRRLRQSMAWRFVLLCMFVVAGIYLRRFNVQLASMSAVEISVFSSVFFGYTLAH